MLYGALMAAGMWLVLLGITVSTLKPWEELRLPTLLFILFVMELIAVSIGAVYQLYVGTL